MSQALVNFIAGLRNTAKDGLNVSVVGSLPNQTLVEQLTEADDVAGVLTFAEDVVCIEILNTDGTNDGVFNVNGIDLAVPKKETGTPGTRFKAVVSGVASAEVTVTGATTYIVSRYV